MHTTKTALQLQRILMPKGYTNATRRRRWRRKLRAVYSACEQVGLAPSDGHAVDMGGLKVVILVHQ